MISPTFLEFKRYSNGDSCINEWNLVDVANNSQRGSDERVREKIEKIKQFAREAAKGLGPELVFLESSNEVKQLSEALQEMTKANLRITQQAEVR